MATLKTSDGDVKLFASTDVYYYAVDNRPLRELLKNDQAINTELTDLRTKGGIEIITFLVESASVENNAGGIYKAEWGGDVRRVVLSCSQPGSSGNFEVDIKADGTTIFTTPGDRPVLAYNDADDIVEVSQPEVKTTVWSAGALITMDILQIQGGTPRWMRCDVHLATDLTDSAATDFD